jgi:hypothetical protein
MTPTPVQTLALAECAEFVKDLVNASANEQPYQDHEIFEIGVQLLNLLSGSGFALRGEDLS